MAASPDTSIHLNDTEGRRVVQLALFLRENGMAVLSGNSRLTLTASSLNALQKGFILLNPEELTQSFEVMSTSGLSTPLLDALVFLYDFVQKTNSLKLIHYSETLQGRVSVHYFRALQSLEVKKVPIILIQGLNRLRHSLETIICTKCLSSLHELLETCGGDITLPQAWSRLKTVILRANNIASLDNSLRLLPSLHYLDLSRNMLTVTENYLEYLVAIAVLDLSFNSLVAVPTFSFSAKSTLHTLNLRYNNVTDLAGIEELQCLIYLDISHNCLTQHSSLSSLVHLHKLKTESDQALEDFDATLFVKSNPLCYINHHRILTLEQLHSDVCAKIIVDGFPATAKELKLMRPLITSSQAGSLVQSQLLDQSFESTPSHSFAQQNSLSPNDNHDLHDPNIERRSLLTSTPTVPRAKKSEGRKKRGTKRSKGRGRVRSVQIADDQSGFETSGDYQQYLENSARISSAEASLSTTPVAGEFKGHCEVMRSKMGADWLKTLDTGPTGSPGQSSVVTVENPAKITDVMPEVMSDRDRILRNTSVNSTSEDYIVTSSQACNSKLTIVNGEVEIEKNSSRLEEQVTDITDDGGLAKVLTNGFPADHSPKPSADDSIVAHLDDVEISKTKLEDSSKTRSSSSGSHSIKSQDSVQDVDIFTNRDRSASYENEVDYGLESEPFIAVLSDQQIFLSLSDRYVIEKDLNGRVVEAIDIKTIINAKVTKEKCLEENVTVPATENGDSNEKLKPMFTIGDGLAQSVDDREVFENIRKTIRDNETSKYMKYNVCLTTRSLRKDLRERKYRMEDEEQAMIFVQLLLPAVERFSNEIAPKTEMECLKCFATFEVSYKLENCPYCKSDMIVELRKVVDNSRSIPAMDAVSMSSSYQSTITQGSYSSSFKSTYSENVNSSPRKSVNGAGTSNRNSANDPTSSQKTPFGGYKQHNSTSTLTESRNSKTRMSASRLSDHSIHTSFSTSSITSTERGASRLREDSTGSDIAVLMGETEEYRSGLTPTEEQNESSGFLQNVMSSSGISIGAKHMDEPDKPGSLTTTTLTSMIESIYENSTSNVTGKNKSNHNRSSSNGSSIVSETDSSTSFISTRTDTSQYNDCSVARISSSLGFTTSTKSTDRQGKSDSTSLGSTTNRNSTGDGQNRMKYNYEDPSDVDHRLTLHISLNVLKAQHEQLKLLLRCDYVRYSTNESSAGLFIVTDEKIYVLAICGEEIGSDVSSWLQSKAHYSLSDIQYIDIGIDYQMFRLEFVSTIHDSISIIIRDKIRGQNFIKHFTKVVQNQAMAASSQLESISKSKPTLYNLESQILAPLLLSDPQNANIDICGYYMVHLNTGVRDDQGKAELKPVSLLLTQSHVLLLTEDFSLPLPRFKQGQTPDSKGPELESIGQGSKSQSKRRGSEIESKRRGSEMEGRGRGLGPDGESQQFELTDELRLQDVTQLGLYHSNPLMLDIRFENELTADKGIWVITMETEQALQSLVESIKEPWEALFCVGIHMAYSDME